jgi:hypothetical protein
MNAGKGRKAGSEGQAIVKHLGKQQVNSLFTHLRKIAQHPLLVRNLFSHAQVQSLVKVAHQRQVLICRNVHVRMHSQQLASPYHRRIWRHCKALCHQWQHS